MIFAYADPPYIGQAKKMYGDQPEYAGEIDHTELIKTLCDFDAWALSCHSNSLRFLLNAAPKSTRVAAWVKPFAYFKKGVNPSYTWEPVLFSGARTDRQRKDRNNGNYRANVRDWISLNIWGVTAAERAESSIKGHKREEFCFWLFELLGAIPGDEFCDLFPGSGAVTSAWAKFSENYNKSK